MSLLLHVERGMLHVDKKGIGLDLLHDSQVSQTDEGRTMCVKIVALYYIATIGKKTTIWHFL